MGKEGPASEADGAASSGNKKSGLGMSSSLANVKEMQWERSHDRAAALSACTKPHTMGTAWTVAPNTKSHNAHRQHSHQQLHPSP